MRIIVNGASVDVEGDEVSYAQVLDIAFANKPIGNTWTVTVQNVDGPMGPNDNGTLHEGQTMHVTEGTLFNIYAAGSEA